MLALGAAIAFIILVIASFSFSLILPSFEAAQHERSQNCYWTDAMLVYVECGPNAFAGSLRTIFYNFWLYFLYFMIFAPWLAVPIFALLIFMMFRLFVYLRRRSS